MKVYLILEEQRQEDYVDRHGESADPSTRVVNVYTSKRTANEAAARYRQAAKEAVEQYHCDLQYYYVVERETV